MSNKAKLIIEVDADAGARQIEKVAQAQAKVTRAVKDTGAEAQKTGKQAESLTAQFAKFAVSAVSVSGIVGIIRQLHQEMKTLAAETNAAQKSFVQLASVQSSAAMGPQAARMAQLQGARYGVNAADAASTAQMMQSLFGKGGAAASEEAFQLRRLGASKEGAEAVIKFGREGGLSPVQAGSAAQYAADKSALGLNEIANAFQSLPGYRDPIEGAAAITAMAGSTTAEKLVAFTQRAGAALWNPESELVRRMERRAQRAGKSWTDMPLGEKLGMIRQHVGTSQEQIAKAGANIEQSMALSALVRNYDTYTATEAGLRGNAGDLTDKKLADMAAGSQGIATAWATEESELRGQWASTWGAQGQRAQRENLASVRRREMLSNMGFGPWSSGAIGGVADMGEIIRNRGIGPLGLAGAFTPAIRGGNSISDTESELAAALRDNTREQRRGGSASGLALGGGHGGTP